MDDEAKMLRARIESPAKLADADSKAQSDDGGGAAQLVKMTLSSRGGLDTAAQDTYVLPPLDAALAAHGAEPYGGAIAALCHRETLRAVRLRDAAGVARLCEELGASAPAYAELFRAQHLDGEVFAEIDEVSEYVDIGVKRQHAVVLVAALRALRGDYGAPLVIGWNREGAPAAAPISPTSSAAAGERLAAADAEAAKTGAGAVYGQLVCLGYKEYRVEGSVWHSVGSRNEKFKLRRREAANGIRKDAVYVRSAAPAKAAEKTKNNRLASHSVTMQVEAKGDGGGPAAAAKGALQHVTIEYVPDGATDMFQVGRMVVPQNDLVIRGPLTLDANGVLCGPVSRYACRFVCSRLPPFKCCLYASGFNNAKDIFLSQSAPTINDGGNWDALTTFGVRIWKPELRAWREVSVNGTLHEPRKHPRKAGRRVEDEPAELTNGTIIDLAGIQLIFESAEEMARNARISPAQIIEDFNARKPQCPVQMHTIRFEYDASKKTKAASERTPYIYPSCGHVHAFAPELSGLPCPLCRKSGPFVELKLEWEPAIDKKKPTVVFNPCGHLVSEAVAKHWAAIDLPDNAPPNARYRPICPFCAKPLNCDAGEKPYNRIRFHDGMDDGDGTGGNEGKEDGG